MIALGAFFPTPSTSPTARFEAQAPRLADRVSRFLENMPIFGKPPLIDRARTSDNQRGDGVFVDALQPNSTNPQPKGLVPPIRRFLGLLVLTTVFLAQPPAHAQTKPPFGQGTHAFRALLKQMGLKPLTSWDEFLRECDNNSRHVLIVGLGNDGRITFDMRFRPFLKKGGAILVARDQSWENTSTWIAGGFVSIDPSSPQAYRGSRDCPIVEPIPNAKIPLFEGLSRVATNRPSWLDLNRNSPLSPLARFPADCDITPLFGEVVRPLCFAAAGNVGKGRLLVLADHSVFINDMLLQPDNDNFDLAYKAISWLTEDGKRDRVLFVEDGEIVTNFNVKLKEPPAPPLPSDGEVIQAANRMLAGLDRENFYNRQLRRYVSPTRLLQWLTVALTLGLALVGGLRLLRARHRTDAKEPLLDAELHRRWSSREKE